MPSVIPKAQAAGLKTTYLWAAAALLLVTGLALAGTRYSVARPSTRASTEPRAPTPLAQDTNVNPASFLALSPDGRRLAFVGVDPAGRVAVWIRAFDGLEAQPLSGSDGGAGPFWSPDSRFVAFVANNKLKRIDASGGPTLDLADVGSPRGGSWNRDDVILFTPQQGSPIFRVSATGGPASLVTSLDTENGEATHEFPFFLPDGRHFLYLAVGSGGDPKGVYVGSLDSKERTRLLDGGSNAQYAEGSLLFMRGATLMAQPFDASRLALVSDAVPVAERVVTSLTNTLGLTTGTFSVSETGALVYRAASSTGSQLTWFDRSGKQLGVLGDRANYADVMLSPDGTRVSVSIAERGAGTSDIWINDVARGLRSRFTFDPVEEVEGRWSPDGTRLAFSARHLERLDLYQKAASGVGTDELLFADGLDKYAQHWSPNGRFRLYLAIGAKTGQDLWVLPLFGERKASPFAQRPFSEGTGQFSPDGRWIAYRSNETGRLEVYVAPFPGPGGKWQISTSGGDMPRWRRDGKELFYHAPDNRFMAATVTTDAAGVEVGAVQSLFGTRRSGARYFYDVSADGQRFLVNTDDQGPSTAPLVLNWPASLRR